jgi:hypothetical protein
MEGYGVDAVLIFIARGRQLHYFRQIFLAFGRPARGHDPRPHDGSSSVHASSLRFFAETSAPSASSPVTSSDFCRHLCRWPSLELNGFLKKLASNFFTIASAQTSIIAAGPLRCRAKCRRMAPHAWAGNGGGPLNALLFEPGTLPHTACSLRERNGAGV